MSLHGDLLEQAAVLVDLELYRPRQASLRRAISTAYYALFHLLIHEGTLKLISAGSARSRFSRGYEHGTMKSISREFAIANPAALDRLTGGLPIPPEIQQVAETFINLQEERHAADYDVTARYTRLEVRNFIQEAEAAFGLWEVIRNHQVATLYLGAMLLGNKWKR